MSTDRDTHFQGFAQTLLLNLDRETPSTEERKAWELVIARAAYLLVQHTIDAMEPYIYDEKIAGQESVDDVPDFTDWHIVP